MRTKAEIPPTRLLFESIQWAGKAEFFSAIFIIFVDFDPMIV